MTTILHLDSSGRHRDSASRALSAAIVGRLRAAHPEAVVIAREATANAEFPDDEWVRANFTAIADRNEQQRHRLRHSQKLIDELRSADHVVIGMPIYNFTIPAALKAWIDQVSRPGLTFRAEPGGFVGLLTGKKAYLAVASGGTPVRGPTDYATGYMLHILAFFGIHDVAVVAADTMVADAAGALQRGMSQVAALG